MTGKYESMFREILDRVPPKTRCEVNTGYIYTRPFVKIECIDISAIPPVYRDIVSCNVAYKGDMFKYSYPLEVNVDKSIMNIFHSMKNHIADCMASKKFPGYKKGSRHPLCFVLDLLNIKHFELVAALYPHIRGNKEVISTALMAFAIKEGIKVPT